MKVSYLLGHSRLQNPKCCPSLKRHLVINRVFCHILPEFYPNRYKCQSIHSSEIFLFHYSSTCEKALIFLKVVTSSSHWIRYLEKLAKHVLLQKKGNEGLQQKQERNALGPIKNFLWSILRNFEMMIRAQHCSRTLHHKHHAQKQQTPKVQA